MATVETAKKVRFHQNHVAALLDYFWGDGDILHEYRRSPSAPVDYCREGAWHVVLISLREIKSRGDQLNLNTHGKVLGGAPAPANAGEPRSTAAPNASWSAWSLRTSKDAKGGRHGAEHQPDDRPWQESLALPPQCGQELVWVCLKPRLNEFYLLRWEW